jgi:uncharacterized protein (TIGR03435 family)
MFPRIPVRIASIGIAALTAGAAFCQSPDAAKPPLADVHVAVRTNANGNQFLRPNPPRGGRYELRNATMLDLVRIAHDFEADKVLGGPSWLEMNRYDVIIQVPANATPDAANAALQAVLADRFKLVFHKETKSLPIWVLTAGKKPLMKEADSDGATGCHPHTESAPATPGSGAGGLFTMSPDGKVTMMTFGPGQTLLYNCRNVTMEAFATSIRGMVGNGIDTNVLDETSLKGKWNFDLKYSFNFAIMSNASDDRISFPDAVEKQLGLKLEQHPNPTPVLIVDSVDEKPSANPPAVAEALPPPKLPAEFEVADIKLSDPGAMFGRTANQPGGRFISSGMPLSSVINNALMAPSRDQVVDMPKFADSVKYDITAKADVEPGTNLDAETTAPMLIALLKERFGLKYHTEERSLPAYSLMSVKPKMKKADPASRTSCRNVNAPPPAPPGSVEMTCHNTTMAQFVEQLRLYGGQGFSIQPLDATGLEGGWDFTLSWNRRAGMNLGPPRPAEGTGDATATAADPDGGLSIFEAIDKQLGLKLEMQKRPVPVFVIDHLDEKPTDN